MNIEWKNIIVQFPKKAHLANLNNVNGEAKPGRLLAIMGPSGCGKSSLIKVLAGKVKSGSKTMGSVVANGKERKQNEWNSTTGFIYQEDLYFKDITVYETIKNSAYFRKNNLNNLDDRISNILKYCEIEEEKNKKMKILSKNQVKRVMICAELINNPQAIFLDEPTVGLEEDSANQLIYLLRKIAEDLNKTVIITVGHLNAEMFNSIDDLLLLSKGTTAYMGERSKCENKFREYGIIKTEESDFHDFIIKLLDNTYEGYYEVKSYDTEIGEIIKDVETRYITDQEAKPKTSNDPFIDTSINLKHVVELLKRRFSLYFFSKKNIVSLLFQLIFCILMIIGALNLNKLVQAVIDYLIKFLEKKEIEVGENTVEKIEADVIMEIIREKLPNTVIFNLFKHKLIFVLNLFMLTVLTIRLPIHCTIASFAFKREYKLVKREISKFSYSISSYYVSVFLYENIILSYIPMIFCFFFKLVFPGVILMPVLLFFIFNSTMCIIFYLFGSMLFKGKVATFFIISLFTILSMIPSIVPSLANFFLSKTEYKNALLPLYLLAFVPSTYFSALQYSKVLSTLDGGILSLLCAFLYYEFKLPLHNKEDLIIASTYSFLPHLTFSNVLLSMMVYLAPTLLILLTVKLLKKTLNPSIRMKLQQESDTQ